MTMANAIKNAKRRLIDQNVRSDSALGPLAAIL